MSAILHVKTGVGHISTFYQHQACIAAKRRPCTSKRRNGDAAWAAAWRDERRRRRARVERVARRQSSLKSRRRGGTIGGVGAAQTAKAAYAALEPNRALTAACVATCVLSSAVPARRTSGQTGEICRALQRHAHRLALRHAAAPRAGRPLWWRRSGDRRRHGGSSTGGGKVWLSRHCAPPHHRQSGRRQA